MAFRPAMLAAFLGLAACGDHDHPHPHPHAEEEPKTAQVTVWGERFEIFLEHRPLVAGTPTAFATHVTDLKTLEPRRKDPVVFVLRQADRPPIEHAETAPKKPGVYVPELTFPATGEWSVSLRIPVDGTESVVDLPKLVVHPNSAAAKAAPAPESPEGIAFGKEQQWRVLTRCEPVGRRTLVQRVRVPATVLARPGSRASAIPPLPGRLLAPAGKAFSSLGDRVEAGQVLGLVQPPFLEQSARIVEAHAESIRAKLALDQAELVLARTKRLAEAGAKTERELQEAEFSARNARAALDAAEAVKAAYGRAGTVIAETGGPAYELRSPIAGVVVAVHAAPGEQVATEKPVFQVLDASTVHLEARIPESDLARLRDGAAALAQPGGGGPLVPLAGKSRRVFLGPEVDPTTRTVPLVFEVENADGSLRIGGALTLHLETERSQDGLAIPSSAVVEEDGRPIAFVQVSGETFEKRYLALGIRDGSWIQVVDGLAEGERVVVKEAMAVRLSSVSNVIPAHGHAH